MLKMLKGKNPKILVMVEEAVTAVAEETVSIKAAAIVAAIAILIGMKTLLIILMIITTIIITIITLFDPMKVQVKLVVVVVLVVTWKVFLTKPFRKSWKKPIP